MTTNYRAGRQSAHLRISDQEVNRHFSAVVNFACGVMRSRLIVERI
jgi:hypothetical protein